MENIKNYEVNSPRWLSLENFVGEVWKDVVGYETLYQVSNLGRIKTKRNKIPYNYPYPRYKHQRILILRQYKQKNGYLQVRLRKDEKYYNHSVHRIVAQAFIPNTHDRPQINHKDENKQNNCANNLEWCDSTYNNNYGTCKARSSATLRKMAYNGTPIIIFDKSGKLLSEFLSMKETARYYPISLTALKNNKDGKIIGDYIFFHKKYFSNDKLQQIISDIDTRKVVQLSINGDFVKCFNTIKEASKETGVAYSQILWCCKHKPKHKTAGGYIWLYNDEYIQNCVKTSTKWKINRCEALRKEVHQFDINGNYINSYESVTSASVVTHISKNTISENCNEKRNVLSAGGYIWSYSKNESDIKRKVNRLKKRTLNNNS